MRWPEGFRCSRCGGSYETAWTWLHKLRRAMVRPGQDRLAGLIEVDEAYIGGEQPGKRGRGAAGKTLVAVAVQDRAEGGIGRIRLGVVPDASQESPVGFVHRAVEPGSTVRSDEWSGYQPLADAGFEHAVVRSHDLKIAHLVIALLKRWLGGTLRGAASPEHLAYYLDEFTFRFNRRMSTYPQMVKGARGPRSRNHTL